MAQRQRFFEHQQSDALLIAVPFSFFLLEAYLSYALVRESRAGAIISALVAALCLALTFLLRRFTVEVTDRELVFGFGFLRRRIALTQIGASSITETSLKTTGIGIHYCPGPSWAWIAKTGLALVVNMTSGSVASYIISTSRPRDLAAAIAGDPGGERQSPAER